MVAPVLPADTMAMALPSRTASAARTSEESFFRRTPWAGSSSMPMTSLAGMHGRSPVSPMPPGRPTRTTSMSVSLGHLAGAGHDLIRGPVPAHGVDGHRQRGQRLTRRPCGAPRH